MTLIKTTNGPLCPMEVGPFRAPQHATMDRVSDVVFHVMKPMVDEETGEAALAIEAVAAAARYGYDPNYVGMRLYRAEVSLAQMVAGGPPMVEAWYFQCQVCGFVLPATARAVERA